MKQFIFKSIIAIFAIILAYEFTIGKEIKKINNEIGSILTKEGRKETISKIKKEMKKGIKKEKIFDDEERELVRSFILKIKKELNF